MNGKVYDLEIQEEWCYGRAYLATSCINDSGSLGWQRSELLSSGQGCRAGVAWSPLFTALVSRDLKQVVGNSWLRRRAGKVRAELGQPGHTNHQRQSRRRRDFEHCRRRPLPPAALVTLGFVLGAERRPVTIGRPTLDVSSDSWRAIAAIGMDSSPSSSLSGLGLRPTRYPSLKAFTLMIKDKSPKPPAPPPKDNSYIHNRILSPDALSIPPSSPMSPYNQAQFPQRTSSDPTQSSVSLVSSSASTRSQMGEASNSQRKSRLRATASNLLTLVKRNARSIKSPDLERPLSPPVDTGISTPWNFQHNIHVDEAFIGLPPSWSTQLASAGFSPEEIAALEARRANLYSGRPDTPNLRINTAPPATSAPILGRPSPRTTSLQRQLSDASTSSISHENIASPPTMPSMAQHSLTSSPSSASLQSVRTTTSNGCKNPIPQNGHAPTAPTQPEATSSTSHSKVPSVGAQMISQSRSDSPQIRLNGQERPSTPPRKPYHTVNASPHLISSPPPAYSSSVSGTSDKKTRIDDNRTPSNNDAQQVIPSHWQPNGDAATKPNRRASIIRNKRNSVLPPRLSLHKDSGGLDWSSWSSELLSGISSSSFNSNLSDSSSRFALGQTPSTNVTSPGSQSHSPKSFGDVARSPLIQEPELVNTQDRQVKVPQRPVPPIILREDAPGQDVDSPAPPTGWAEPASANRLSPSSPPLETRVATWSTSMFDLDGLLDKDASISPSTYSAALEDSFSPILPISPEPGPSNKASAESRRNDCVSQHDQRVGPDDPDQSFLHVDDALDHQLNRNSSRSSTSTMSTVTVAAYESALVRNASIVRRTSAYVIDRANLGVVRQQGGPVPSVTHPASPSIQHLKHPSSPLSSNFGSEDSSPSGSVSSGSASQDHPTPTDTDSPLGYYMGATYMPSPGRVVSATKASGHLAFNGVPEEDEEDEETGVGDDVVPLSRPRIVIDHVAPSTPPNRAQTPERVTPLTPAPRYRGWLSEVVKPLEDFIDEATDPREYYIDLQEIAEGESGSVFAAQVANYMDLTRLRLDPALAAQDRATLDSGEPVAIAIKSVAILPSGSPKLVELERELKLMKGLLHENLLSMEALYVDLVEDSLWIRMELMERSLADVVSLAESGVMLHDRMIARFASDVLQALQFLQRHNIAHRDVRSDNLLLNSHGILKLADFSTAVQVLPSSPMRSDVVGVAYWQAPEVRTPPYNALKVDIWSLGATLWETAEAEPPFASSQQLSDRWPPLSKPKMFSPAFHDFLRQCSEPAASRPDAATLSSHPLMKNACGRTVVMQLLAQCMTIEKEQLQNEDDD
ncbi:hypothetical protein APHAL10511_002848 [Amanita phalloides]|nr:hypothetical protein APHAL10511_002848 [Amanita phalloides]